MSNELVTQDPAAELAALESEADALAAKVKDNIKADEVALPLVTLAQALSKSVKKGIAKEGEFVNNVTGRNLGSSFELVIAGRFPGRFLSEEETGRAYVAANTDVVPDNWPDKYKGQRFSELIDAEEQFGAAVDEGEIQWGNGPPISTTHNFVGYVPGETDVPIRISLMRSSAGAATTINTLLKLFKHPWSNTIRITAEGATDSKQRAYFRWSAAEGEAASPADQVAAIKLAQQLESAKISLVGDEDAATPKPEKPTEGEGALPVS